MILVMEFRLVAASVLGTDFLKPTSFRLAFLGFLRTLTTRIRLYDS